MAEQEDGSYPRINGGMLQTQQFNGMIVSAVGKLIGPNTLQTADGTNVTLDIDNIAGSISVNPDICVEIIGNATDGNSIMAFVARELSADLDLDTYNKMLAIQHNPKFAQYFQGKIATN